MFLWNALRAMMRRSRTRRYPRGLVASPAVERLEDRWCPSGGYLMVASYQNNAVLRYDESTGAFVDQIDPKNLASLVRPVGMVLGPDHNLYVSDRQFSQGNQSVLQYDGTSGAFLSVFASQNLTSPRGVLFGPDGNLYVANGTDSQNPVVASVERFDGKTGAFLGYFVTPGSGGIDHPAFMVFGPDGNLYVDEAHAGSILRYDGVTGAPLPSKGNTGAVFVPPGSGGLDAPQGMVFGPDGSLYVASSNWFTSSNGPNYTGDFPPGAVLRYDGKTGAFLGTFIPGGSGGLANPDGLLFGPGGDLYVSSCAMKGVFEAISGTSQVLRYDGMTGAFQGAFVVPDGGGLRCPISMTFTETDPTTLNYDAATAGVARSPDATMTKTTDRVGAIGAGSPLLGRTSRDGAALTVGRSIPQPPTAPAGDTTPALIPTQGPLFAPPLGGELTPAGHGDLLTSAVKSDAAAGQIFASTDARHSFPMLMDDLTAVDWGPAPATRWHDPKFTDGGGGHEAQVIGLVPPASHSAKSR